MKFSFQNSFEKHLSLPEKKSGKVRLVAMTEAGRMRGDGTKATAVEEDN
jgi:hypothetical protein